MQVNSKIWKSRINYSSNLIQLEVEEIKEVNTVKPEKVYLPLNQHQKRHHHRRRFKGKKCWMCKSRGHLKKDFPMQKCFYYGKPGHIKKKYICGELNMTLLILKDKQRGGTGEKKKAKESKTNSKRLNETYYFQGRRRKSYLSLQKKWTWAILWGLPIHHREESFWATVITKKDNGESNKDLYPSETTQALGLPLSSLWKRWRGIEWL